MQLVENKAEPKKVNGKKIKAKELELLVEAAIFSSDKPLSISMIKDKLLIDYQVSTKHIRNALTMLALHYQGRGIELVEVASGFRFQVREHLSTDIQYLQQEKAPKYSRALLETLSLVAYKQPITRGEIEEIRGVAVSSHIIKTLIEREWIKIVAHKEVPGRPAMYATTKEFLDYFSLKSLSQLPELMPMAESTIVNHEINDIMP